MGNVKQNNQRVLQRQNGGRPSLYRPEFVRLAFEFCALGATNDQMARIFGISVKTLELWLRTKPHFARAINRARAEADAVVAKALFRRALGFSQIVEGLNREGEVVS